MKKQDTLNPAIPNHMNWTVTMWHFGADALVTYEGEKIYTSWEFGQLLWTVLKPLTLYIFFTLHMLAHFVIRPLMIKDTLITITTIFDIIALTTDNGKLVLLLSLSGL